jgi:alpha-1,2-mannosyltransferase
MIGSRLRDALQLIRTGDWLTRERLWFVPGFLLLAVILAIIYLLVTRNGLNDFQGRPLGTDFSSFYAAGTYVNEGHAASPYNPIEQHAREREIFGADTPFFSWFYPPLFLLLAAGLALLPYAAALLTWQASTLALYLAAMRAILVGSPAAARRKAEGPAAETLLSLLLALAFPAVFVNVGHGQNGLLTAALLGGALAVLPARPILAGVLFGALAYKPQFGLMIPLALLAGREWRAFAAAAATVGVLVAMTLWAFGPAPWQAFFASAEYSRTVALEAGDVGWHKLQSVFAWVRLWNGPLPSAYAAQGAAALLAGVSTIWLWRGSAAYPLKAAALCLATILATPFALDYDMMVLAPAIAFLAVHGMREGFAPYEKTALALLWFVPAVARTVAQIAFIPIGAIAMIIIFAIVLGKASTPRRHLAPQT